MPHRLALHTLVLCALATTASSAFAGKSDLHPFREPPRDAARAQAREAAKLKLVAKMRGDAPAAAESKPTSLASSIDAPIFHRYDQP